MNSQSSRYDRAAKYRTDLQYLESQLGKPTTRILPIFRGQAFVRGDALGWTSVLHADDLVAQSRELIWLGMVDGEASFGIDISTLSEPLAHAALSGNELSEMRPLLARLAQHEIEVALYARALFTWHERQQFCGQCGHPTRPRQGGHMRLCARPECGAQHFPRTDPCVLVLVCDGDRCLLGRSRGWPAGMYSALAGFVEPGESLEQAAAREVLEESGVQIGALRYTASEPWPFPASLMIGFMAEARSREIQVDGEELEAARWVSRAELKQAPSAEFFVPGKASLSGRLIAAFAAEG